MNLLVEAIVCGGLVNRQSNFIKSGNLNDSSAFVAVHVIVAEIRYNLSECNDIGIGGFVL